MKYYRHLTILLFVFSCILATCTNDITTNIGKLSADSSWSRITKDSLKLEFRRKKDTLFTNIIDLRGTRGDDFDDSHSRISTFDSIICKKIKGTAIKIVYDSLIITFNSDSLKRVCKDKSCSYWFESNSQDLVEVDKTDSDRFPLFEIFDATDMEIKDLRTGKVIGLIIVENYESPFDGGEIYHFIGSNNDTLYHTNLTKWMR